MEITPFVREMLSRIAKHPGASVTILSIGPFKQDKRFIEMFAGQAMGKTRGPGHGFATMYQGRFVEEAPADGPR